MGIRFLCPNGHRLNVKSHLAGMRGICPECAVRFVIPTESGGTVEAVIPEPIETGILPPGPPQAAAAAPSPTAAPPAETAPPSPPAAVAPPPPPAVPSPAPPTPATATPTLPDMWYVNTGGQQFGPANTETFHSWVAAGRVPDDSLVWRTGWAEWKTGSAVLAELDTPPVPPVEPATLPAVGPEHSVGAVPVDNYQARQRRRRDRAKVLTMSLSALVFLLLVVLVVVLVKD